MVRKPRQKVGGHSKFWRIRNNDGPGLKDPEVSFRTPRLENTFPEKVFEKGLSEQDETVRN